MEQKFNSPPVLLIMFNRPHMAAQVFEKIRQVRPSKLFLAVDAARPDRLGEADKVTQCQAFKDKVDWKCDVKINFADKNMGCRDRMSSAITWAFEHVKELIILEDDCVPDLSFFRFCREMLDKYRDDNRVFTIGGSNHDYCEHFEESYAFAKRFYCWGWATWKRAWKTFDITMNQWNKLKQDRYLKNLFRKRDRLYFNNEFQMTYDGKINSWAYRYWINCLANHALHIVPRVNLVRNTGFEPGGGTNMSNPQLDHLYMDEPIEFPLTHPDVMASLDRLYVPATFPENALERAEFQKKLEAILTEYDATFRELLKFGQHQGVKILFKQALRDERLPRFLTAYHLNFAQYNALARLNLGDYEHAEALANVLLTFNPRNVDLLLFLANASLQRNDRNKTYALFKTLEGLNVTNATQREAIARIGNSVGLLH